MIETSWLTADPCLWLGSKLVGGNSILQLWFRFKWRHQRKMAALVSWIFWLLFCTIGGRGDVSSIFIDIKPRMTDSLSARLYNSTRCPQEGAPIGNKSVFYLCWCLARKRGFHSILVGNKITSVAEPGKETKICLVTKFRQKASIKSRSDILGDENVKTFSSRGGLLGFLMGFKT